MLELLLLIHIFHQQPKITVYSIQCIVANWRWIAHRGIRKHFDVDSGGPQKTHMCEERYNFSCYDDLLKTSYPNSVFHSHSTYIIFHFNKLIDMPVSKLVSIS